MILILSILVYSLCSCKEEIDHRVNPYDYINNDPEVEVVWKIPIFPDTSECSVMDPVLYIDKILFGGKRTGGDENRIALYDPLTQEIIWEANCEISNTQVSSVYNENIFVGICSNTLTSFDMNNGTVLWAHDYEGGHKITNFGDKIFHTNYYELGSDYVGHLVVADLNMGIWDTVFTLETLDEYRVSIYPPGAEVNDNNDTILYFQNRQWNFSESDGKIDLYAFNMSADTLVWVAYDIEPDGNSSVQPPVIYDEKVYFRGSRTIYCFDALTGEKIWEENIGIDMFEDLLNSNTLVVDDMLIVKTGGYYLYAFDPETGEVIWSNPEAGATPSHLKNVNGHLYYGCAGDGMIHVVDAASGETIKEFESPAEHEANMSAAGFYDAVAVDPVNNYLYAADGYFLYCIKIDW